MQGLVAAAAAAAVTLSAPTSLRAALGLPLFLGIGFVDSSICGLCTESMVGSNFVDRMLTICLTSWQDCRSALRLPLFLGSGSAPAACAFESWWPSSAEVRHMCIRHAA